LIGQMSIRQPNPVGDQSIRVEPRPGGIHAVLFSAMASPCEVLLEVDDAKAARLIGAVAAAEAWRIEAKFSRYRPDSELSAINRSAGKAVPADAETLALIDFAERCFELSDGLFDVTSGILRRAWKFDCSDRIPSEDAVRALLPSIGLGKINWDAKSIAVPAGMEIDLGGIAKEYAVDRVIKLIGGQCSNAALVNFGGDLRASGPTSQGAWEIGVEKPDSDRDAILVLELTCGALATSGDTHRYLLRDGIRYCHILDPRTGWPVQNGPRSVTVAAGTCLEAGMLATIALLQGNQAHAFLEDTDARYWCLD
jgi:thiamine biosynthesis lipoprotein